MNNLSMAQETNTKLIGTTTTIFGETLTPLVSSSKNLKRPALDAGNGLLLFFFFYSIYDTFILIIRYIYIRKRNIN